jgi:hypothetical protein
MNCYEEYAQTMATTQSEPVNYEEKYGLSTEQADELRSLVADLGPLNFKRSADLSRYIVRHKLGYRSVDCGRRCGPTARVCANWAPRAEVAAGNLAAADSAGCPAGALSTQMGIDRFEREPDALSQSVRTDCTWTMGAC